MYLEPNLQKATPKRALIALNSHPPKYLTGKKWITKGTIKNLNDVQEITQWIWDLESPYHIWASQQGSRQYEICWDPVKSCIWLLGVKLSMDIFLPDHKACKETYETWCGPVQSYHLPRISLKCESKQSNLCHIPYLVVLHLLQSGRLVGLGKSKSEGVSWKQKYDVS